MGRFLMNVMLASSGYPWTVTPVSERYEYMAALEEASVGQDITRLAAFLARLVRDGMEGKSVASLPAGQGVNRTPETRIFSALKINKLLI